MAFKRSGVRFPSPPPGSIISMARRDPRARNGSPEPYRSLAGIAQLVEHNLAKVGVAGSSPVSRFFFGTRKSDILRQYASDFARNSRESTLTRADQSAPCFHALRNTECFRCIVPPFPQWLGRLAQLVRAPR